MAYVAGKESPTAADVKKILTSIDAEVDDAAVDSLVSALKGKDIAEVIAAGRETMKGMVIGGGLARVRPQGQGHRRGHRSWARDHEGNGHGRRRRRRRRRPRSRRKRRRTWTSTSSAETGVSG